MDKTRLDGLLFAIVGDDTLVERWWNGPNKAFDMQKPIDMFEVDSERVRDYILKCAGYNK
jgi:hypothetical protein